ncbi:MAG: cadmium-translocating P-type ATPase, partial [Clostridia bacterium]|nr:cadmium-translocating P-type ATPase [Clostridia bacterium]
EEEEEVVAEETEVEEKAVVEEKTKVINLEKEAPAEEFEEEDVLEDEPILLDDTDIDEDEWAFDDDDDELATAKAPEKEEFELEEEEEVSEEDEGEPEEEAPKAEKLPFFRKLKKEKAVAEESEEGGEEESEEHEKKNEKVQVMNLGDLRKKLMLDGDTPEEHEHHEHTQPHDHIHHEETFSLRGNAPGMKTIRFKLMRLGIALVIFLIGLLFYKLIKATIWVGVPFFIIAYIFLGIDIWAEMYREKFKEGIFDEKLLMTIASLAALIVGEYPEAVIVMLLYQLGELLEDIAVGRSKKNIRELMNIRPDRATVIRGGEPTKVHASQVSVGELILVRPGERVPLDGKIEQGKGFVDTSALTGESVPRRLKEGDEILAGFICKDSSFTVRVEKFFADSTASKVLELVEKAAEKKAPAERFITKFSRYYTPAVIILALLIAVIPSLIFKVWKVWVYRACILLVIACPCALVISVPMAFFAGLGVASRNGVLVKGANYLEALNSIDTVVFDKTGTLTKGTFGVTQVSAANNFKEAQLLTLAAHAECQSNHPIAKSIMDLYYKNGGKHIAREKITDYKEIAGHGISVKVGEHLILAGNAKLMRAANVSFTESTGIGTKIYVAADGEYAGYIVIADEIREDAREAITELKLTGVEHSVMLTGDNADIAANIAKTVGVEKYYAELLPDDKVEKLEEVMTGAQGIGLVAFVGDGINDAPVLARADIGVAMGGIGSDAAIEAADVVIMDDQPSKLVDAINIARDTKMIVKENIIASLGVKGIIFLLGILGVANMWFAIFADVGVMLLAVANSMRLLRK